MSQEISEKYHEEDSTKNVVENVSGSGTKKFRLDSYGSGDLRLLRYLDSGLSAWEAPVRTENDELMGLKQYAESFCVANDTIERFERMKKNENEWASAVDEKNKSLMWLINTATIFDLLLGTANIDIGKKFLKLTTCRKFLNDTEAFQDMKKSFILRKIAVNPLLVELQVARDSISVVKGIQSQIEFLKVIDELRGIFKISKKTYSHVDFEQNDVNYPYVSEILVEYISIPSDIWNVPLRHAIFLSWSSSNLNLFVSQHAHLIFKNKELQMKKPGELIETMGDEAAGMIIRFDSDVGNLIENLYCLSIEISFDNVKVLDESTGREINYCGDKQTCTFPKIMIPPRINHPTSKEMFKHIKEAQWIIVDKAIFCVLCSHTLICKDENNVLNENFQEPFDKRIKKELVSNKINQNENLSKEVLDEEKLICGNKFISKSNECLEFDLDAIGKNNISVMSTHMSENKLSLLLRNVPLKTFYSDYRNRFEVEQETSILNVSPSSSENFLTEKSRYESISEPLQFNPLFESSSMAFKICVDLNLTIEHNKSNRNVVEKGNPSSHEREKDCFMQDVATRQACKEDIKRSLFPSDNLNQFLRGSYTLRTYSGLIRKIEALLLSSLRTIFLNIWYEKSHATPKRFGDTMLSDSQRISKDLLTTSFLRSALHIISENLYLHIS